MKYSFYKLLFCLLSFFLFLNTVSTSSGQSKIKRKTKIATKEKLNDDRRKEVESLMLDGRYQHDGSGELIYIGTIESVPALIKVLEDHPPRVYQPCKDQIPISPPPPLKNIDVLISAPQKEIPQRDCSPKTTYICTYGHAVSALRKITGQNFIDFANWKSWWEKYQSEVKFQTDKN